jgi:hypothetical protein
MEFHYNSKDLRNIMQCNVQKCTKNWYTYNDIIHKPKYLQMFALPRCFTKMLFITVFFLWRWGGSSTQAWMPTFYVSILCIPQMIWVWTAMVEWYWQRKTEELGEKPVPVPLCPPQIPHGLTQVRTRASAVRGWRLTTWAMARPLLQSLTSTELGHIILTHSYYSSREVTLVALYRHKDLAVVVELDQRRWILQKRKCRKNIS